MDANQSSPSQEKREHLQLDKDEATKWNLIWDEYKYRHNLIWAHLIRSTLFLVGLLTIRYASAFKSSPWLVQVASILALVYWLSTFVAISSELQLFIPIKELHRERQERYIDRDFGVEWKWIKWKKGKLKWIQVFFADEFSIRVFVYLILLLIGTVVVWRFAS
ncbi:MAG: hypothetical protein ACXWOL_16295 [Ktedonobacteraceae bacterium]